MQAHLLKGKRKDPKQLEKGKHEVHVRRVVLPIDPPGVEGEEMGEDKPWPWIPREWDESRPNSEWDGEQALEPFDHDPFGFGLGLG